MDIFNSFGLRKIINGYGKMTVLGTSTSSETVSEAVKSALKNYVVIDELMDYAGEVIAEVTKSEGGCPTSGAASGIAIASAACIAGENLNKIESLPDSTELNNEIIIQKGHLVNFGGNIGQMIRLGGGIPVEIGCANQVLPEHLEGAINSKTAAILYVKSHHAVQKGMLGLEKCVDIGKKYKIPVIVDGAAEENLQKYTAMGADLVIYSGGKAICGPSSGFICGRTDLIRACRAQYKGIGRAMKVSKEAMAGLITALKAYEPENIQWESQKDTMSKVCEKLNQVKGLKCRVIQDEAGRAIYRAEIHVNEKITGITAEILDKKLKEGNPAIYLRAYNAAQGILHIDPRTLFLGQESEIIEAIKNVLMH